MNLRQTMMLLIMSAIWGSSFVFMKFLVPVFGPVLTSSIRLLSASLFMFLYLKITRYNIRFKGNIRHFAFIGVFNSGLPFVLYSFASLHIDASVEVVLNSTSPMFGALFAYLLLKDRLVKKQVIGLLFGLVGVIVVSPLRFENTSAIVALSLLACITAAALYGLSGSYIKKYASHIDSKMMTTGSLLFAGLLLLPIGITYPVTEIITLQIVLFMAFFGIFGTAVTYIIYYSLMKEVGATKALTVTYLMPPFGVLWAYLFVSEVPSANLYLGILLIFMGVYLTTKKSYK